MEFCFFDVFESELLSFGNCFLALAEENDLRQSGFDHLVCCLESAGFEGFGEHETLRVLFGFLGKTFKECHDICVVWVFQVILQN